MGVCGLLGHARFGGGDQRADFIADEGAGHVARLFEAEDADALLVVAGHGQCGGVHDGQIVHEGAIVAQGFKTLGVLVLARVGGVDAADAVLTHKYLVAVDFEERWMETVSVEKYGMPAPAPKITTRPFSR